MDSVAPQREIVPPVPQRSIRASVVAAVVCAGLLLLFGFLSYSAALTKSATFDEPLHLVGGFIHRTTGDFRVNPEDPALFGDWASLPFRSNQIQVNYQSPNWGAILGGSTQWSSDPQGQLVMRTLYRTPENDGEALVQRSRFMFVIVGVMLGAVIAWWSWRLGGAFAAVAATVLYGVDPNFLAHAALVKNDVMLSLLMTAVMIAVWRFGRRGTWLALSGMALACAIAVNVKFSGLFCGPLVLIMLMVRTLIPRTWRVVGFELQKWWQRLLVVPAVCLIVGCVSIAAIWACYGFRFAPTSDPSVVLNTPEQVMHVKNFQALARYHRDTVSREEIDRQPPGAFVDAILWAESHRLLPHAWLHGLLFTYATTLYRFSFLLGEIRATGWWYYFPCAVLFKTPTATLLAGLLAIAVGAAMLIRRRHGEEPHEELRGFDWWAAACLGLPMLIYFGNAMTTRMNVGLRHVLPVYPFAYVLMGIVFAAAMKRWRRLSGIIASVLAIGLMTESLAAYPHYLAFFNAPSGGRTGGIRLLSDSNLDWGQDLKLLARWQESHADKKLYLNYFGSADPAFYHIAAVRMPGGYLLDDSVSEVPAPTEDCYIAISATNLQGLYYRPDFRPTYQQLLRCDPIAVLGGSIYIYQSPLIPRASQH
jgi:hypothetical protein